MKLLWRIWSRLRGVLSGRDRDSDLAEELALHIEMQTDDNIRAGMAPLEARRAARLKFGGVESIKESYRDQRGVPFLETLFSDLRYALRQLRKNPGFTVTIVTTIALGISANVAVFSIINAVLLKPLPVSDPDRLVWLTKTSPSDPAESHGNASASPAEFVHWRAQTSVLEGTSAFLRTAMNYTGSDTLELWSAMQVSADIFRIFRMPMLYGRTFTAEEERPNGPRVAVISRGLWQRRFGGDPQALGRIISLSGEPYTLVGIVADSPGFFEAAFDSTATDAYVPFQIDPDTNDIAQILFVVARLKPGVTAEQALERLRASAADFRARFPRAIDPNGSFGFMTINEAFNASEQRAVMLLLMVTVNGVLLIACANVANLLLVRSVNRRREIGIRIAVGAGRRRVIRQLLTESLLLSLAGGTTGLFLGNVLLHDVFPTVATALPPIWKIEMDWHVVAFALGLSALTALIFGLLPAFQASRVDLNTVLKDSGDRWSTGRQNKLRSALVVSEVSLAVILLIGSALLIRSFMMLSKVDRGFETRNVFLMYTSFSGPKYSTAAQVSDAIRNGLDQLRALPGVEAAGAAGYAPLTGNLSDSFIIAGRAPADGSWTGSAGWTPVSSGYFDVFRIPVKRGRAFTERDTAGSAPVVVINETMAKTFWKDGDPLNDRVIVGRLGGDVFTGEPPRQIVGIVGDVRQRGLNAVPDPRVYVPEGQLSDLTSAWLVHLAPNAWAVRTQAETHDGGAAIQEQLRQATGLPVYQFRSMNEVVSTSTEDDKTLAIIMSVFSGLALLLAVVGIYGVMTYTVEQRRQEIGIRLALGAEASSVRNMVVRQGMRLTLGGVALGIGAAWGLMGLMQGLLFGVQPRDPIVFVTVPVLLSAVAFVAVWRPATRASQVNPMDSLRYE